MLELDPSILDGKLPIYSGLRSIAILTPRLDVAGEVLTSRDATVEAMPEQRAQPGFSAPFSPTAVLGGVVNP